MGQFPGTAIVVPLTIEGALPAHNLDSNIPRIAKTNITLDGNASTGVVHHLGHHHLSPYGNDRDSCVEGGQRNAALIRELQ